MGQKMKHNLIITSSNKIYYRYYEIRSYQSAYEEPYYVYSRIKVADIIASAKARGLL